MSVEQELVTILIVEDDPGVARLEQLRLERAGYRALEASTLEEARRVLSSERIELMLLDHRLKDERTGLDFYRELKRDGLAVPTVLITGYGDDRVLVEALRAGFRDFLPKTTDYLDYLIPTVARVLEQVGTERALASERATLAATEAARRALEQSDRLKDEFLATLAHELRNPLAPLQNALVVMEKAADDSEMIRKMRSVMERQLRQLVRLVDDLLDLSRVTRGKIELRLEEIELSNALQAAVETSRPLIDDMGHRLDVSMPKEPVRLQADLTRLAQVFANLLNNAAKYTERGGRLEVSVESEESSVIISMRDSGVGISAEMLPRVFEMFTQADRSIDKAQGGLGIGLTLVKRLVEMHEGTVEVVSEGLGRGSEFRVTLPTLSTRGAPVIEKGPVDHPVTEAGGRRILIADDNHDSADSLKVLLELSGYSVVTVGNGAAAVDKARAFRPHVMVLDIGMPGMSGYEVARKVRALPEHQEVVLVAMTGWGQDEDRRQTAQAGFDHHLVKPVDFSTLEAILRENAAGK